MNLQRVMLVCCLSLIAVPVVMCVPGCSGGSSSSSNSRSGSIGPLTFDLNNGQQGTLALTYIDRTTTGELTIAETSPSFQSEHIPTGTYRVSGLYYDSQRFSIISEAVGEKNMISLIGALPTRTVEGRYTLEFNGQTLSGSIPVLPSR